MICFGFIIKLLISLDIDYNFLANPKVILSIICLGAVYGIIIYLLGYTWKLNLDYYSEKRSSFLLAVVIYSKSNIAKYIPGNIFQYAGRNAYSRRLGLDHIRIVASTVTEIIMLCFTCLLWCLILARENLFSIICYYSVFINLRIIIVFLIILVIMAVIIYLYYCRNRTLFNAFKPNKCKGLVRLLLIDFVFYSVVLLSFTFIFIIIVSWSALVTKQTIGIIMSAYLISWICGFLIPGAPGGLGVREIILSLLLKDFYVVEVIMMAVVIQRVISILGDVFAWIAATLIEQWKCI